MYKTKFSVFLTLFVFSMITINSARAQGPIKYQSLSQEERVTLEQASSENTSLRFASAGGSDCRTTWHTDPNSGEQTQRTVCNDSSSSSGPSGPLGPGFFRGCFMGGLGGALLGSLGGASGAAIGAGAGCLIGGIANKVMDP